MSLFLSMSPSMYFICSNHVYVCVCLCFCQCVPLCMSLFLPISIFVYYIGSNHVYLCVFHCFNLSLCLCLCPCLHKYILSLLLRTASPCFYILFCPSTTTPYTYLPSPSESPHTHQVFVLVHYVGTFIHVSLPFLRLALLLLFFLKYGPTPTSFFIYFWSFQSKFTNFYNKYM